MKKGRQGASEEEEQEEDSEEEVEEGSSTRLATEGLNGDSEEGEEDVVEDLQFSSGDEEAGTSSSEMET